MLRGFSHERETVFWVLSWCGDSFCYRISFLSDVCPLFRCGDIYRKDYWEALRGLNHSCRSACTVIRLKVPLAQIVLIVLLWMGDKKRLQLQNILQTEKGLRVLSAGLESHCSFSSGLGTIWFLLSPCPQFPLWCAYMDSLPSSYLTALAPPVRLCTSYL